MGVVYVPEFRELITKLKNSDAHFTRLFERHNELDQRIKNMESNIELATNDEVELLKKEKLHIKDELYAILKKKSA
ncbi:YdcH family protein [Actinobacillus equuli]|uniref:YdcH family protein n=1 Tax=Actinobacillus equuli TaxID=718 RepID=UPI0024434197|nr:YdcH family protein [Actinobacillus equuli]WGE60201.1 YdcH family protein [Actinobacillus equuli subsp. haemolyticus]WGE62191.1 YdcH family protein [Actinobacillus equuli subsp. haemolyticus]